MCESVSACVCAHMFVLVCMCVLVCLGVRLLQFNAMDWSVIVLRISVLSPTQLFGLLEP